jgi:hypothetical protein
LVSSNTYTTKHENCMSLSNSSYILISVFVLNIIYKTFNLFISSVSFTEWFL